MGNHALVFGATGIQGWAVVNQLLSGYPTPDTFERVTALTNRPVTEEMLWPASEKLQIISGINLLGGEELANEISAKVPRAETVTHVFFFAYAFQAKPEDEIAVNVDILKRGITAVESLSRNLKFVVLPTGTKAYGVHLKTFPFANALPLSESLPRIPEPYASQNFYYHQTDWLNAQCSGKAWTFCELRPDVIIGFVPNNNVYCLAQSLATYLALYSSIEGKGAVCPFPGTETSWKILSNDSGQDGIARFAIHAALHPETCGQGQAFNVASHSKPTSWSEKWPVICEFFGLIGTPPLEDGSGPQPVQYLADHQSQWHELEQKFTLARGRVGNDISLTMFPYFIMTMLNFDRQMDLSKQQSAWSEDGEVEEENTKQVWWSAFQRFRDARIIP